MNITDLGNGSSMQMFNCGPPPEVPYTFPTYMVMAIINGIIAGGGMLGNALVVFVLLVATDRQDTSSVTYVLNLAIADFCFLATVPFVIDQKIHIAWRSGEFMCKFAVGFMTYLNFFVSPLFLMVMSIDRYLAVNKAVSSTKLRNLKSSRLVSVVVWLVALAAVIPLAYLHSTDGGLIKKCKPRFPGQKIEVNNIFLQQNLHQECIHNYTMKNALKFTEIEISDTTTIVQSVPIRRVKREIDSTAPPKKRSKKQKNKNNKRRENKRNRNKKRNRRNRFRRHKLDLRESTTAQNFATTVNTKKFLLPDLREPMDLNFVEFGETPLADFDARTVPSPESIKEPSIFRENAIWAATQLHTTPEFIAPSSTPPTWNPFEVNIFCAPPELQQEAIEACLSLFPNDTARINTCYHDEPYSFQVWTVLNFFYSYLIPCSVIVVCYMAILRKLYQPTGMIRSQESRGRIRRHAMRKKVTLMVAMLVLSYIVCFTPYYIFELIKVPGVPVAHMSTCNHISKMNTTLAYVNSALNPILYTFLSDQFGSKLRLAWRRVTRKTAYHFGSVMKAGERRHIFVSGHRKSSSSKRKPPKLSPREATLARNDGNNCNGSNRVVEDQRHLMEIPKNENNNEGTGTNEVGYLGNKATDDYATSKRKEQATPATDVLDDEPGVMYQREKHETEHQRAKRKGSLFSCVADCTESEDEDCPHCAIEMGQIVPQITVHEEQNDVTDDVNKNNDDVQNSESGCIALTDLQEVPDKKGRKISTISTLSNLDTGYFSANAKLCRKHKRSVRFKSKELDNDDSGKWVTASSFRSESRYPTELTETSPM
ncbi:uncharacterized protein LOC120338263 isoform X1 [Styela clava]